MNSPGDLITSPKCTALKGFGRSFFIFFLKSRTFFPLEKNKKYPKGPQVGDDLRYDLTLKSSEAIYGKQIKITIPKLVKCYECRGTGGKQGHLINCETCGGYGEVIRVTRTPFGKYNMRVECSECNGFGVKICKSCSGKGVKQTRKKIMY